MKYNLKTKPDTADIPDADVAVEFGKWFEGFEAELREKEKLLTKHIKEHIVKGEQTTALEAYRAVIKEILGES